MVSALTRKLWRDVWRLGGQALTIALVVASGIASYVSFASAQGSLVFARDAFYLSHRFADVFVHAERAPRALQADLEAIPGVEAAEVRLVVAAMVPLPDMTEPVLAQIVSLPATGRSRLCDVQVRRGSMPEPGHGEEVLVLDSFARIHGIEPGDTVPAVLNGVLRELRVSGTAMSPEYVFAVSAGEPMADEARVGVFWMREDVLAPAFQLEGAFNDALLALNHDASERAVLGNVDRVLEPYGGLGAYARDRQPSHLMLSAELRQLSTFALVAPAIFLGVAVFLVYVVLSRIVNLERPQIATLKALGYSNLVIASHYIELVSIMVLVGTGIGLGLGAYLGSGLTSLYADFFRFPSYGFRVDAEVAIKAVVASAIAAFGGALTAVWSAVRLPPAQAMQAEPPARYKRSLVERLGLAALAGASGMMVVRELTRRPIRTVLYTLGIATAVATLVSARFGYDAMDLLFDLEFQTASRDDLLVSFREPLDGAAVDELRHLPGVVSAEQQRAVPVRVRSAQRYRDVGLVGHADRAVLRRLVEHPMRVHEMPPGGLVLTEVLAERLEVEPGDRVTIEVLSGDRRKVEVVVSGISNELFGMQAHARLEEVHELLGEVNVATGAALSVEHGRIEEVEARLKEMPGVGSVLRRDVVLALFKRQTSYLWTTTLVLTLFAATIAVGIVYNSARVALSMRARDLASLRVLGFTRREIATLLLSEIAVYVVAALPLGLWLGRLLTDAVAGATDPELYRMRVDVSDRTYAFAVAVTVATALVSAVLIKRRIDALDLIGVLKTRE